VSSSGNEGSGFPIFIQVACPGQEQLLANIDFVVWSAHPYNTPIRQDDFVLFGHL